MSYEEFRDSLCLDHGMHSAKAMKVTPFPSDAADPLIRQFLHGDGGEKPAFTAFVEAVEKFIDQKRSPLPLVRAWQEKNKSELAESVGPVSVIQFLELLVRIRINGPGFLPEYTSLEIERLELESRLTPAELEAHDRERARRTSSIISILTSSPGPAIDGPYYFFLPAMELETALEDVFGEQDPGAVIGKYLRALEEPQRDIAGGYLRGLEGREFDFYYWCNLCPDDNSPIISLLAEVGVWLARQLSGYIGEKCTEALCLAIPLYLQMPVEFEGSPFGIQHPRFASVLRYVPRPLFTVLFGIWLRFDTDVYPSGNVDVAAWQDNVEQFLEMPLLDPRVQPENGAPNGLAPQEMSWLHTNLYCAHLAGVDDLDDTLKTELYRQIEEFWNLVDSAYGGRLPLSFEQLGIDLSNVGFLSESFLDYSEWPSPKDSHWLAPLAYQHNALTDLFGGDFEARCLTTGYFLTEGLDPTVRMEAYLALYDGASSAGLHEFASAMLAFGLFSQALEFSESPVNWAELSPRLQQALGRRDCHASLAIAIGQSAALYGDSGDALNAMACKSLAGNLGTPVVLLNRQHLKLVADHVHKELADREKKEKDDTEQRIEQMLGSHVYARLGLAARRELVRTEREWCDHRESPDDGDIDWTHTAISYGRLFETELKPLVNALWRMNGIRDCLVEVKRMDALLPARNQRLKNQSPDSPSLYYFLVLLERYSALPEPLQRAINDVGVYLHESPSVLEGVNLIRKLRNTAAHSENPGISTETIRSVRNRLFDDGLIAEFVGLLRPAVAHQPMGPE